MPLVRRGLNRPEVEQLEFSLFYCLRFPVCEHWGVDGCGDTCHGIAFDAQYPQRCVRGAPKRQYWKYEISAMRRERRSNHA